MGFIALVRCVLVLRCGLAGVVWCGIRMQASASLFIEEADWFNMRNLQLWVQDGYKTYRG